MVDIKTKVGVNDYLLNSNKIDSNVSNITFDYEDNKLSVITVHDVPVFTINGTLLNEGTIYEWLKLYNPYVYDGEMYFPDMNLIISKTEKNKLTKFEIIIYSDVMKTLYERNINGLPRFNDNIQTEVFFLDKMIVKPFVGLGDIFFNDSSEFILRKIGNPKKIVGDYKKTLMYWDNIILFFKEDKLIQILLENPNNIFFENINISELGNKSFLFEKYSVLLNRSYSVYSEIGLAFLGFDKKSSPKTIIIFSESLKIFWLNTKRPLLL